MRPSAHRVRGPNMIASCRFRRIANCRSCRFPPPVETGRNLWKAIVVIFEFVVIAGQDQPPIERARRQRWIRLGRVPAVALRGLAISYGRPGGRRERAGGRVPAFCGLVYGVRVCPCIFGPKPPLLGPLLAGWRAEPLPCAGWRELVATALAGLIEIEVEGHRCRCPAPEMFPWR